MSLFQRRYYLWADRALAAQQTGLQVTGNNIANAGTDGYSRQTVSLSSDGSQQIAGGQFLGTGVTVQSIQRQANDSINQSPARCHEQPDSGYQTLDTLLSQVQTTFGTLTDNDISSRMTDFFTSFSSLANNPGDMAQRAAVVQGGASLADYLQIACAVICRRFATMPSRRSRPW